MAAAHPHMPLTETFAPSTGPSTGTPSPISKSPSAARSRSRARSDARPPGDHCLGDAPAKVERPLDRRLDQQGLEPRGDQADGAVGAAFRILSGAEADRPADDRVIGLERPLPRPQARPGNEEIALDPRRDQRQHSAHPRSGQRHPVGDQIVQGQMAADLHPLQPDLPQPGALERRRRRSGSR
jgi:hypothetical protein